MLQVLVLIAQSYAGPAPVKADVPYLLHAGNLIQTEVAEAKESKTSSGSTFSINGAKSPVKTPLASPIFILRAEKIVPERLQVFALESREGSRILTSSSKTGPQTYTLTVKPLKNSQYHLEVNESLPAGEYALTTAGANPFFCFAVY